MTVLLVLTPEFASRGSDRGDLTAFRQGRRDAVEDVFPAADLGLSEQTSGGVPGTILSIRASMASLAPSGVPPRPERPRPRRGAPERYRE